MDTTQAINILETESLNLGVEINIKTNLKTALDLAVQQLQGTLTTQMAALDAANLELATANETIATLQTTQPTALSTAPTPTA